MALGVGALGGTLFPLVRLVQHARRLLRSGFTLEDGVEATRDEARHKLREAVAALEKVRLGLLFMHAGNETVENLTMDLETARGISDQRENLLAGHREVERNLQERRKTGVYTPPVGDRKAGDE